MCAEGDIDNRNTGSNDVKIMQEGARIHRKIQHSMGTMYHAEVPLKIEIPLVSDLGIEYVLQVEGRADGIIADINYDEDGNKEPESDAIIDEIKTMQTDVSLLKEPVYVHKAQALVYGYIYASQKKLSKIGIQMTYVTPEPETINKFLEEYTFERIEEWFNKLITGFKRWTDYTFDERHKRTESIRELKFPYEYREGQKNLCVSVYRAIEDNTNLYIQAPTGVGKTLSTVFPAVQALGQQMSDKIFYLTSKTITRTVAEDTYAILRDNGLHMRTVTLTAKDKICPLDERNCNPVACPYAKGHFDRINDAVYDIITSQMVIGRDNVMEYANRHNVCPFEMSLDVSYWCDGIICDYNYVFDPDASLKRYFGNGAKGDYVFLVDEAHNLVDRAREMYSAVLKKEDFLAAKKLVKEMDKRLAGALVVNVMQTSQENSLMLISHSPLKGEESLRNQKIAVWNHLSQKLLDRLAEHYALKQVEWIRFNSGVNVFLSGAADPCLVGSYNEYLQLSEYGMNVDSIYSIRLADYGYNLPEDGLYVTEEFYNQYPEVVRKLVKASMRGWAWTNEHREEALDMVMEEVKKGNIGTNRYHQRKMLEEVLRLQVDRQSGQRTYRLSREGFARAAMILTPAGSTSIRYEDFVK